MNDINSFFYTHSSKMPAISGNILLAQPLLQDSYFSRSVIFLIDNGENGTMGLMLNHITDLHLEDFETQLENHNTTIYWGGPVDQETFFFLHTLGDLIPDSYFVANGIYCGGNWEIIKQMLNDKVLNHENFRLFMGYSGWVKDQLKSELDNSNWAVSTIDADELFKTSANELWRTMVINMGSEYAQWINLPVDPEMN